MATAPQRTVPPHNLAACYEELFSLAAKLSTGREPGSPDRFRDGVQVLLTRGDTDAVHLGYSEAEIGFAGFAIIALLDEIVLNSSAGALLSWANSRLSVEIFQIDGAGVRFFETLNDLLKKNEDPRTIDVLEVYLLCLLLGFRGQFGSTCSERLQAWREPILEKLQRVHRRGRTAVLAKDRSPQPSVQVPTPPGERTRHTTSGTITNAVKGRLWPKTDKERNEEGTQTQADQPESAPAASVVGLHALLRDTARQLRLAKANSAVDSSSLRDVPVVLVMGPREAGKTSVVSESPLRPELLSRSNCGTEEDATQIWSVWLGGRTVFIEIPEASAGDANTLKVLGRSLRPRFWSLFRRSSQAPRSILFCADQSIFTLPDSQVTEAAQTWNARLSTLCDALATQAAVSVVLTKMDRIETFSEFAAVLGREEAAQPLGATLLTLDPASHQRYPAWSNEVFCESFARTVCSLRDSRIAVMVRESDVKKRARQYEFPRHFARLRDSLGGFLRELTVTNWARIEPILRGYYFSGTRTLVERDPTDEPLLTTTFAPISAVEYAIPDLKKRAEVFGEASAPFQATGRQQVTERLFAPVLLGGALLRDEAMIEFGERSRRDDIQHLLARRVREIGKLEPAPSLAGEIVPIAAGLRTAREERGLAKVGQEAEKTAPPTVEGQSPHLDETIQFTVYRPGDVQPEKWYQLLAFAHLAERRPDAPPDEPDPVQEVKRQAASALGEQAGLYRQVTEDSTQAVPRQGEITFVPEIAGVEFNPTRRSFLWRESLHKEEFRMRATSGMEGRVARGRLTVFLGSIIVGDIPLSIRVGEQQASQPLSSTVAMYRKIFASYSHKDVAIVEECERYARSLGDQYVRDLVQLRTGEVWDDRLRQMIEDADVFQLFWSQNSLHSRFVRQEWEHALALPRRGTGFIRPVYWEEPLPEDPRQGLPPEGLRRLHFQRLSIFRESAQDAGMPPPCDPTATSSDSTRSGPGHAVGRPAHRSTQGGPEPNCSALPKRHDDLQLAFDFNPPSRPPFANVLQPTYGLLRPSMRRRFYALIVDSIIVVFLSLMFAGAVFVAFWASSENIDLKELLAVPWYAFAGAPVVLSLCYKVLFAVLEHPTVGLQCFRLDVIRIDGRPPSRWQRILRPLVGWLTIGGLVDALWPSDNQKDYSMRDRVSGTVLVLRPAHESD